MTVGALMGLAGVSGVIGVASMPFAPVGLLANDHRQIVLLRQQVPRRERARCNRRVTVC